MGMFQGRAGCLAVVFEYEGITEPGVFFQVNDPVSPGPEHLLKLPGGYGREHVLMVRRFYDYLVRSDTAHLVIYAFAGPGKVSLYLKRRVFVRDNPSMPAGCVGFVSVCAVCDYFIGRHLLVAGAKRAEPALCRRGCYNEFRWA